MPLTYQAIATVTVGAGGAASMTFSNIPQTFTDLAIKVSSRKAGTSVDVVSLTINGGSTAINANRYLDNGAGSPRSGAVNAYQALAQPSDYTANTFGSDDFYIPNYTSAQNKSIAVDTVIENNATASFLGFTASLWPSNAAITSLTLTAASSTFVQHSSATLYGIKNS